jgi:hypothetical protein
MSKKFIDFALPLTLSRQAVNNNLSPAAPEYQAFCLLCPVISRFLVAFFGQL